MATFFLTSQSFLSSCNLYTNHKKKHKTKTVGPSLSTIISSFGDNSSLDKKTHLSVSVNSSSNPRKPLDLAVKGYYLSFSRRLKPLKSSVTDEPESEPTSSSSVAVAPEEPSNYKESPKSVQEVGLSKENEETEGKENQQEMDWKTDEEFKKFMGNPSIEAAIKLEKKRADRKLKEFDRESSGNPIVGLFNKLVRDNLTREKERLEQAEETFKALDLNKVIFFFFQLY